MKNTCKFCKGESEHFIADQRRYTDSGLTNVFLRDVEVRKCKCGESLVLKAAPKLQTILALCMAYKPAQLSGPEIRFIRGILRRTGIAFAKSLSISPEHLSRIENGAATASAQLDKLIRLRALVEMLERKDPTLRKLFHGNDINALIDTELPADDGSLALFVRYRGPHSPALKDGPRLEFEFSRAA